MVEHNANDIKDLCLLIADDDENVRVTLRKIIQKNFGITNIIEAKDGDEAMDALKSEMIDMAILDFEMPGPNGLMLAKYIRGNRSHICTVLITGGDLSDDDYLELSDLIMREGDLKGYLRKPWDLTKLIRLIQACWHNKFQAGTKDQTEQATRRHYKKKVEAQQRAMQLLATIYTQSRDKKENLKNPFTSNYPRPLLVFNSNLVPELPEEVEMAAEPDWRVDRGVGEASKLWGVKNFPGMLKRIEKFRKQELGNKNTSDETEEGQYSGDIVCSLGPGDGTILRELEEHSLTKNMEHVGIADRMFFSLPQLLESGLQQGVKKNPILNEAMMKFIRDFSIIILNEQGLEGLLEIKLGSDLDENQLRRMLIELPKMVNLEPYISGEQQILHAGEFSLDSPKSIDSEVQRLLKEYIKNPYVFFEKYFVPVFYKKAEIEESPTVQSDIAEQEEKIKKAIDRSEYYLVSCVRNLLDQWNREDGNNYFDNESKIQEAHQTVLDIFKIDGGAADIAPKLRFLLHNIRPDNVRFGDFQEVEDMLGEGTLFTAVHASRSLSHLDDASYQTFVNEILIRLKPGGIMLDDGIAESYTRHLRVSELRTLQKKLEPEYKFHLIGDHEKPKSVIIQRGIKQANNTYNFIPQRELRDNHIRAEHKIVSLGHFETTWPKAACKNEVIKKLRWDLFNEMVDEISLGEEQGDLLTVWRGKKFRGVHEALVPFYEKLFETVNRPEDLTKGVVKSLIVEFLKQRKILKEITSDLKGTIEGHRRQIDMSLAIIDNDEKTFMDRLDRELEKAGIFLTKNNVLALLDFANDYMDVEHLIEKLR